MKFKDLIKTGLAVVGLGTILTACDNVDEADRYIELETISAKRVVLLEEFTGQDCTNCPDGHKVATQIMEQFGESFIPVSIHASTLSWKEADEGPEGLGIPEGEEYYKAFSSPALPAGVVDRVGGAVTRNEWQARVRTELEKEAPAAIDITSTYDPATTDISVKVDLKPTKSLSCKLTVWIIESGIVAYQYDNGKHVTDYVHNHVLRAVATDVWGDQVSLSAGVFTDKSYTYNIKANKKEHWNPDNLSIVAFISDDSGVLQAAEAKIVKQ